MFRGIIKEIGLIVNIVTNVGSDKIFYVETQNLFFISKGDSIACSGVCLTVLEVPKNDIFAFQVSQATMEVTNLFTWKIGKKINLEQAMKLSDGIDGHLVQGHVDGVAKILRITPNLDSHKIKLSCPYELTKFIAKKGSVTLDGTSLTVNSINNQEFEVNIIPYTWSNTTFQYNKVGNLLNLEVDIIARYLERFTDFTML